MNQPDWKKNILPHLLILVGFLAISYIYFSPQFSGKVLHQGDIVQFKGSAQEIKDFREKTGEETLWTNSMFGGMPTYQIAAPKSMNLFNQITAITRLGLPRPGSYLFVSLAGFYLLLLVMGVNRWLSVVGAIAFSFSTYNFLILEAGHNTKFMAMSYMAPVVAGVLLAYQKKWLLGGALFSFAFALNLRANHPQITYYLFLLLLIYAIAKFIESIRAKTLPDFAKASAALIVGAGIGLGTHAAHFLLTAEYSGETIRGKSELQGEGKSGSGLDKDYALAWSYGKMETMSLLIPRFMGGASGEQVSKDSNFYKKTRSDIAPTYWGPMPFTGGPFYFGAIIIFLFFLGCLLVKGTIKWWLVAATILAILLSWGKNLEWFTDIFFYYFPMYNKFRVVSMILVIAQFTMALLGILGLQELLFGKSSKEEKMKAFTISLGGLSVFLLFWITLGAAFLDFENPVSDARYAQILDLLRSTREDMMRSDAMRSLGLVLVAGGVIFAFLKNKVSALVVTGLIGALILGDLWQIGKNYLNDDNFVAARKFENVIKKSQADEIILSDGTLDYRVLNIAANTFNDATTSYYHKSIGGYHGAKLRRYNDIIDNFFDRTDPSSELQTLSVGLQESGGEPAALNAVLTKLKILNMLNTRYIIYNPDAAPILNNNAMGNAWFVADYREAVNANEEMAAMKTFNPYQEIVVNSEFGAYLNGDKFTPDTDGAFLTLVKYKPNHLTYKSNSATEQIGVFSEIYYDKGWQAYIDDKPVDHIRANYILRALRVPSGEHTIEFKFEPATYAVGNIISLICSLVLLGGCFWAGWRTIKSGQN